MKSCSELGSVNFKRKRHETLVAIQAKFNLI